LSCFSLILFDNEGSWSIVTYNPVIKWTFWKVGTQFDEMIWLVLICFYEENTYISQYLILPREQISFLSFTNFVID
jgi:hypothetical protein